MINGDDAKPVTPEEIERMIVGKKISYEDIAKESSEEPSTWYVDKKGPKGVITFEQPYEVVREEKDDKALYKIEIKLDPGLNHKVTLLRYDPTTKEFKSTPSIPNGLVKWIIKKLDSKPFVIP